MQSRRRARIPALVFSAVLLSGLVTGCDSGEGGWRPVIRTAITVDCMPKAGTPEREYWEADVAAFQKLHSDITVIGEETPCGGPLTSTASPASPRSADVFYATFAEAPEIIEAGQAADLTPYVAGGTGAYANIRTNRFTAEPDRQYGVPWRVSTVGLLYNRTLFEEAGLNPDSPPTTWDGLRDAAKKVNDPKNEIVGYAAYAGGNDGGLSLAAHIAGAGYGVVAQDGEQDAQDEPEAATPSTPEPAPPRKADFNAGKVRDRLRLLRDMRWRDGSMGDRQPLSRQDAQQMMAEGRLGMYLSTPDDLVTLIDGLGAKPGEPALAAAPESAANLVVGDGFMISPKASAAKVRAALLWLEYWALTPGRGLLDYGRAAADGRTVGPPAAEFFEPETAAKERRLRTGHATLPTGTYGPFESATNTMPAITGPPRASEVDAILGDMLTKVLTDKKADIQPLLDTAEKKVNTTLTKPR